MYYRYLALAIATVAPSVSACTFALSFYYGLNSFDGGSANNMVLIYENGDFQMGGDNELGAYGDITGAGGCTDLDYKEETCTFC